MRVLSSSSPSLTKAYEEFIRDLEGYDGELNKGIQGKGNEAEIRDRLERVQGSCGRFRDLANPRTEGE